MITFVIIASIWFNPMNIQRLESRGDKCLIVQIESQTKVDRTCVEVVTAINEKLIKVLEVLTAQ